MKYIKLDFEEIIDYIEIDDDGYATRQINIYNDMVKLSCREDHLAEGIVDTKEYCAFITADSFNEKWEQHISVYNIDFSVMKKLYPIGSIVNGIEGRYYPQGVIIDIDGVMLACDREKNLSLHNKYCGIVVGYDEANRWILTKQLS